MTLSLASVRFQAPSGSNYAVVHPSGITSDWQTIISAGGPLTADNSGNSITTPATQIVAEANRLFRRDPGMGTNFLLRLAYSGTPTVQMVVQPFGRMSGSTRGWQPLYNALGTHEITLTYVTATDHITTVGGTAFKHTQTVSADWLIDTMGCDEFLVGIKVASVDAGSDCYVEAKFV